MSLMLTPEGLLGVVPIPPCSSAPISLLICFPLQLIKDCNENVQRMKSTEELIYLSQKIEFECKVSSPIPWALFYSNVFSVFPHKTTFCSPLREHKAVEPEHHPQASCSSVLPLTNNSCQPSHEGACHDLHLSSWRTESTIPQEKGKNANPKLTGTLFLVHKYLVFVLQIFPLISQSRRLVKCGELTALDFNNLSPKWKVMTRPIYLHLFNDCLLLSRPKE